MEKKVKKIPMRQCMGCSEHYPKKELLRVVLSPEGEVSLDFTGKKSGRGAYICKKESCYNTARKARRFNRALSCEIPEEILEKMRQEISANE